MDKDELKIGMLVDYHRMIGGPVTMTNKRIRSEPWQLGDGNWVVAIEDKPGGVSLEAITLSPLQNAPMVRINWNLWVDCPKCNETIDLNAIGHLYPDHEAEINECIFNNKWDELEGYEVICPECEHEFHIKGIEY